MQHTLRRGFSSLSSIARSHDDLPAFNAAYWVLTLLAAMLFNAGAFMMLIAGHMALDVVKYRDIHGRKWLKVAEGVARENLIDVSVVALGVAFAVYCHTALPIVAGLRGILRTEIAIISGVVQVLAKTHVLHGFLTILADIHAYPRKGAFSHGQVAVRGRNRIGRRPCGVACAHRRFPRFSSALTMPKSRISQRNYSFLGISDPSSLDKSVRREVRPGRGVVPWRSFLVPNARFPAIGHRRGTAS
jgi:hypothetical protein